jgi:hypothetical protein
VLAIVSAKYKMKHFVFAKITDVIIYVLLKIKQLVCWSEKTAKTAEKKFQKKFSRRVVFFGLAVLFWFFHVLSVIVF